MKHRFLVILLLSLVGSIAIAQKAEILNNKSVIDLYKAGLDNDVIVSKIGSSDCKFDLSTTGLLSLKKAAVPSDIIKAMLAAGSTKPNGVSATMSAPPIHTQQRRMPDIEMMNIPYFYDAHTNAATTLEKTTGDIKGKLKVAAVLSPFGGSSDIYLQIAGDKATIRITQTDTLSFLVNAEATPAIFTLYRLTAKKGKREAVYQKDGMGKSKTQSKIGITFKKLHESQYQFYPAEKLAPGEYCLLYDYSMTNYDGKKADVFAFGVD